MKVEQLKLYDKYKHEYIPDKELIYIGVDKSNRYCFMHKHEYLNMNINILNSLGLNIEQIIKNLNLEIYIDEYSFKRIKGYSWDWFIKENFSHIKPILKDKLKNIINR